MLSQPQLEKVMKKHVSLHRGMTLQVFACSDASFCFLEQDEGPAGASCAHRNPSLFSFKGAVVYLDLKD